VQHAEVTVPSLDEWEKQWKEDPKQITQPRQTQREASRANATHGE
jgi:hypothetical protein